MFYIKEMIQITSEITQPIHLRGCRQRESVFGRFQVPLPYILPGSARTGGAEVAVGTEFCISLTMRLMFTVMVVKKACTNTLKIPR